MAASDAFSAEKPTTHTNLAPDQISESVGLPTNESTRPAKDEFIAKARAAGWTDTTAFDYDEYQRSGGDSDDWLGASAVYEWSNDYGDVAPRIPELEEALYGNEHRLREGAHRGNLDITVVIEGPIKVSPILSFKDAGLHPVVLENIEHCGYKHPTPIQAYAIPAVNQGYDVVAVAQTGQLSLAILSLCGTNRRTGSGKTAAYLVPILSKLMGKAKKLAATRPNVAQGSFDRRLHGVRAEPLVVVVVPTRELAVQIFDDARRLCYRSMLRPCVAYGGFPMRQNLEELSKGCDILIATPGRLCDLMDRPDVLSMSRIKFTVIDEADEMLDQDWAEELGKIMGGNDTNQDADHVYMMFSATFPKGARQLARDYMAEDYFRIRVGRAGQCHKNIRQEVIEVAQEMKREATYDLLFSMEPARTLIFCNVKQNVDLLDDYLYNRGLPTTSIHADRNQKEREDAIRAFRTGRAPILIATGVSSRGWDIKDVKHVINYDLPSTQYGGISEYIHRIGRTARMGHQGLATSFYNDRNEDLAEDLVKVLVECDCEVPDFLQHLIPEGGKIEFDDDTDDEADGEDGGDGFAGDGSGADGGAPVASASWGAPADCSATNSGWGAPAHSGAADSGFTADGGDAVDSSW